MLRISCSKTNEVLAIGFGDSESVIKVITTRG